MREAMDLDEDEPLKWNMSQSSATRRRLDEAGWTNRDRRAQMIGVIRAAPITLLADLIYDDRESRRPPLDFYKEALDWLLLRFRNFVTGPPTCAGRATCGRARSAFARTAGTADGRPAVCVVSEPRDDLLPRVPIRVRR